MSTRSKCELENKVRRYLYVRGRYDEAERISYLSNYKKLRDLFNFESNKEMCDFFDHEIPTYGHGIPIRRKPCYLTSCATGVCREFDTTKTLIIFTGLDYKSSRVSINRLLSSGGCKIQIGGVWYYLSRSRQSRNLPLCRNNMVNIRIAVCNDIGRDLIYLDNIVEHYNIYRDRENNRQHGVPYLGDKVCRRLGIRYHPIEIEEDREIHPPRAVILTRVRDGLVTRYESITSASVSLKTETYTLLRYHREGNAYPLWWDRYLIEIED